MVESLLDAVSRQSLVPDAVHLVLDGYEGITSPALPLFPLMVIEHRMLTTGGPGGRWRVVPELPDDAVLVVFDDDQCLDDKRVVEALVKTVLDGGAASYMGVDTNGCGGVLGARTRLVSLAAGVSAYRVVDLVGLGETAAEVQEKCGFDPFGELGDDDAVVSAHLWRKGVTVRATGPLEVHEALGGQEGSQFVQRQAAQARNGRGMFWQREQIARVTGWPWRV